MPPLSPYTCPMFTSNVSHQPPTFELRAVTRKAPCEWNSFVIRWTAASARVEAAGYQLQLKPPDAIEAQNGEDDQENDPSNDSWDQPGQVIDVTDG